MQIFLSKLFPYVLVFVLGFLATYKALEASENKGTIKEQEKTISYLKQANKAQFEGDKIVIDSLLSIIAEQKENANVINLSFDKTKLKGSGNIIIDTKQLQALSCDTVNIVRWYEGLKPRERRKFR